MSRPPVIHRLRLVDELGRGYTCLSCEYLERDTRDRSGVKVFGLCAFHSSSVVFDSKADAREAGCTFHSRGEP